MWPPRCQLKTILPLSGSTSCSPAENQRNSFFHYYLCSQNWMPIEHLIQDFIVDLNLTSNRWWSWNVSVFLQAFWKEKGFSGEIVAGSSTDCPFCVTFDATSPRGNPALVGFISGQQATLWSAREVKSIGTETGLIRLLWTCVYLSRALILHAAAAPEACLIFDLNSAWSHVKSCSMLMVKWGKRGYKRLKYWAGITGHEN